VQGPQDAEGQVLVDERGAQVTPAQGLRLSRDGDGCAEHREVGRGVGEQAAGQHAGRHREGAQSGPAPRVQQEGQAQRPGERQGVQPRHGQQEEQAAEEQAVASRPRRPAGT